MIEEWSLGRGFRSASSQETEPITDGQQAGEVAFHGESLTGGNGPGWAQSVTPGSSQGRAGRKIGVRVDVNGFGGGVKSKQYPDGQALSGAINRETGHGEPVAEYESGDDDGTLANVAPPKKHATKKTKGSI